ncbi:hypothetical protein FZEAL_5039 [Fusarium zealandicum]|uniref:AB hydrolase-1 domain-containing protein n=1 Tax=Fusarium zealandicum TaxID=1053134 RepID=A0A8H4XLB5_9HYPO|nr:hypothetical protein FZEAL_5039 [Fusarium zealandicum]
MKASPELLVKLPTGVRLCYQTFGDASDPAVIFISGATGSMLEWREEMLALFSPSDNPRYIIRFDHRDTGLSTEFPVPAEYSLADMAGDVEGLADHLDLASKGFHVVGVSMGGPIAYTVAARRPQQVKSLMLLMTTPGVSEELPLGDAAQSLGVGPPPMPGGLGNEREVYINHALKLHKALATQPFDDEEWSNIEAQVAKVTDRDMKGGTLYSKGPNHGVACYNWPGFETLKDVKCPTTVVQAAKDPFFGVVHGEALAKAVQGAQYVQWEDVGHELPKRIWSQLAEASFQTWKRGEDSYSKDAEIKE